jgi:hypothetical protein
MREPWCLTPDQVARLTDFQIEAIIATQVRQNDRQERAMRGTDGPAASPPPTGRQLDREYAVSYLIGQHGYTREAAEAAVDKAAREG